jgi:hypothetical protein
VGRFIYLASTPYHPISPKGGIGAVVDHPGFVLEASRLKRASAGFTAHLHKPVEQARRCRKVRWKRQGSGKSGGVRVIYYNRLANGEIWLLTIYAKSAQDNIPSHILKAIKETIDHA